MTVRANLTLVADAVPTEPPPDLSYEYRERNRINSRDWAGVHIAADRAPALPFFGHARRAWR